MTTSPPAPETATDTNDELSWKKPISRIALQLSGKNFSQEELATLAYRFNPEHAEQRGGAFWRIMVRNGLPMDSNSAAEIECWATIIAGMARITTTGPSTSRGKRAPHHDERPVGRTLYLGSARYAQQPHYPEPAMQTLLSTRGKQLRRQVTHAMNAIAAQQANCNVVELANLLRFDLEDARQNLQQARLTVAQTYYSTR